MSQLCFEIFPIVLSCIKDAQSSTAIRSLTQFLNIIVELSVNVDRCFKS